jgi:polyhydroxybutyrate depolymerase
VVVPSPCRTIPVACVRSPTLLRRPRFRALLAAALALAPLPSRAQGRPALTAGDHTLEVPYGGLSRRYIVHVPPPHGTATLPVMLALHGGGGSASQFKKENGLDAVADRGGFLAVYPDGTGPLAGVLLTWNAGPHCCGWAREHAVDDVGFLVAVLDDLARRTPVDARRIYATGHSNGSMMAYRLAAERADRIVAIVTVAGAMDVPDFHPSRPVAVLDIHSVDDPRALYDGGRGPAFPGTNQHVEHQPVQVGLARWAANNKCRETPRSMGTTAGTGGDRGQTVTRLVYDGCAPNGAVEHLKLTGAGHGWPGVNARRARQRLLGPSTSLVDASEEAWAFASRFTR